MTPVFMIGTQRSGSNLLRLMINQLSQIASPHPPHILERMSPLLEYYADLSEEKNFTQLVDDVCKLVELNPVVWEGVKLDRQDVKKRCRDHSLVAVHGAVYDVYAEAQGAKTWCCKSLANILYTDEIERYFAKPKYIYLYRDGRDVALSFQKAVVGEKHIYNIAKEWTETQELALKLKESIGADRFFNISYEELTAQPEESARSLCKFLEVEYTPSMLDFHKTSEAKNAASSSALWGNVSSPVMSNNSKKYQKEMDVEDIKIFESVAGHVLDELGYARDYIQAGQEKAFTQDEVASFNEINKRLKMSSLLNVNEEDMARRKKQTSLLDEIKVRSVA